MSLRRVCARQDGEADVMFNNASFAWRASPAKKNQAKTFQFNRIIWLGSNNVDRNWFKYVIQNCVVLDRLSFLTFAFISNELTMYIIFRKAAGAAGKSPNRESDQQRHTIKENRWNLHVNFEVSWVRVRPSNSHSTSTFPIILHRNLAAATRPWSETVENADEMTRRDDN